MPRTASPVHRRARTEPGGGTSVSAGRTISLSAVLIVAAATALVVYLANREDDAPMARAPGAAAAASDDGASDGDGAGEAVAGLALDAGVAAANEEVLAPASFVQLDALYDDLAAAELYTWVDVSADDPEAIVLRTWYCNDDRVAQAVDRASRKLRGAGFRLVRCLERAGTIVFEKPLR